jgi:hypothetical protein
MTNKHNRTKPAPLRGRIIAASLIGAAGFLSATAYADAAAVPVTQAATQQAAGQPDGVPPSAPAVFETAPSIPKTVLDVSAAAAPASGAASDSAVSISSGVGGPGALADGPNENIPWALDNQTRPVVLNYASLIPLNGLYFTLPTVQQARVLLPGSAADAATQARYVVGRYVTDNIGSALQVRAKQLESLNNWVEDANQRKKLLPKDDKWAAYEFNREALEQLHNFGDKVDKQSAPTVQRMTADVQYAVSQISPLMEATGGYEQKLLWYNALVQLKDGVNLYQTRVADSDRQMQVVIARFEQDNPPLARPDGNPPPEPNLADGPLARRPAAAAKPSLTPEAPREPAQAPVTANKQDSSDSTGGVIVVLGMLAVVVFMFLKLRKRVSNKGAKPDNKS